MRGTLVDFLDAFEKISGKHALHRNLMSTERRAQIDSKRNVRPLTVKRDIDFSENRNIKNFKALQSQYWGSISYTLFVLIVSWLQAKEWDKEEGTLEKGDEVTVFGEKAGETVDMNSFWGTITDVIDAANGIYEVTDKHEQQHQIECSDL